MRDYNCIGIAADHAGYHMKIVLLKQLQQEGYNVTDYGDASPESLDDYPDYVIPLARAIAAQDISRGIAICGSGVGACIAGNKVANVRACLIQDAFSARQGVEDDDMNLLCLGARAIDITLAWKLTQVFLAARFSNLERHVRRLNKIKAIENN